MGSKSKSDQKDLLENAGKAMASGFKNTPEQKRATAAAKAANEPDAPSTTSVDLSSGGSARNFESSLKKLRKKTRTTFGGDTGGYGGNTKLG